MDQAFIKRSATYLVLIVFLLTFLYMSRHFSSDYYFHLAYHGDGDYPPFVSQLLEVFSFNRSLGLFIINIMCTVALPYILIHQITKKTEAAIVYLFSGIPMMLFVIWLVPQSIIQVLMLSTIAFPETIVLFILLGPSIHEFWWAGLLLVLLYWAYQWLIQFTKGMRLPYGT